MRNTWLAATLVLAIGTVLAGCSNNTGTSQQAQVGPTEQQALLEKSRVSVNELRNDPVVGKSLNDYLPRARAIVIFPNLVKAGFFVGAGGGQGAMMIREGQGWSDPVFVYAADASFGLQIGVEGGAILFTVMNDGAVQKLLHGNVNLGGDVSVAVGPVGAGAQGATTPNVGADLVAFAKQQGAYAGVSVKGGVIEPRQEWNDAYYGRGVSPDQIIRMSTNRPEQRDLKIALESARTSSGGSR